MSTLSRRGFLILGGTGAAGVALAGCGAEEDPRAEGDDPELLDAAIEAEGVYGLAAGASADQQGVSDLIVEQSRGRVKELSSLGSSQVTAGSGSDDVVTGAEEAIAAYRQIARLASTEELRTAGTRFLAQVAAELAAVLELEGEDPVPYPFVTGLTEPPLNFPDDAPTGTTTTTTTEGG